MRFNKFILFVLFFRPARVTIHLNTMEPGKALDNWHSLTSAQHKTDMGSVRITAKFKVSILTNDENVEKFCYNSPILPALSDLRSISDKARFTSYYIGLICTTFRSCTFFRLQESFECADLIMF